MRIRWSGHACFVIEGASARVLTDPYDEDVPYPFPKDPVDLVTVSHDHFDHNAVARVSGNPTIIKGTGSFTVRGVSLRGIPSFHDDQGGAARGANTIYAFTIDGIRVAHLGDLGTTLDAQQLKELRGVELLLIPVGGHFTVDAEAAADIVDAVESVRVVIPMHYKTDRIADWPIDPVEPFASRMKRVRRRDNAEVVLDRKMLPRTVECWILPLTEDVT